jgi:hypothetical protein
MCLRNQIEAAIRSSGGDFSEASHAVLKLLDEEAAPNSQTSFDFGEHLLDADFVED